MPLNITSARFEAAAFGAGLANELAGRIQKLAAYDANLWVVPPDLVKKKGVLDPRRAGKSFGVDAILTGSLDDAPDNYSLRLRLLDSRTLDRIEEIRLSAGTREPWHADLNRRLAGLLDVDLDSSALEAAARGCSLIPGAFDSYIVGLGYLWIEEGAALDSAAAAFEAAISRDSSFCDARVGYAHAQFLKAEQTNDTLLAEKALTSCRRSLELDSANAAASIMLGNILSSRNKKEEALAMFERAISLSPRDPEARRLHAWTQLELGRYEKAENAYQALIAVNPGYWGGYESLGYLYYVMGRYQDAVVQFERVGELAPDHAPTYNYLGALYYILERWEEATRLFEKSFALGKNYEACANLGSTILLSSPIPRCAISKRLWLSIEKVPSCSIARRRFMKESERGRERSCCWETRLRRDIP
ncbi:MAG: tetratricopeptide repeat protein [Chitinivibrionia bacterium]|nr:tetratricopeptide repeat protein [Chitinivibrionia bacterium]